jgi:predicted transcriptional regulator
VAVERHNPRKRHSSINALAKHLHRQYRNVFDDVKTMERLGLVEKDTSGHFYVLWDEIDATFKLAA